MHIYYNVVDRTRDPKRNIPEFPATTVLFYQDFIAGDKNEYK